MARLEDLQRGIIVKGILPDEQVTVVDATWVGDDVVELVYKDAQGAHGSELLFRNRETSLEIITEGLPWSFDGDGKKFRLVSEAYRIKLSYLFDRLAVHTSQVEPLPHQLTAVYDEMLPRRPLRYLLADDPGAGKTIMTGLYLKELLVRGDLERCMIVCPGSLVEQWRGEMRSRFHLSFEILTRDHFNAAGDDNPFQEKNLIICRLDQLSRNESIQEKIKEANWDIIVCDEAHKMSATFSGNQLKRTKRYSLGELLSEQTRHFLLLTATPHNGKETDFQLFMALLDPDRFGGSYRDDVHSVDTSDLMRRMVKEKLYKFDGKPLFPERHAYTVNYSLSPLEKRLYDCVTKYVCEEMNRADSLKKQRKNRIGFALTILQRRLASSPEAIYRSIQNRRNRLEDRLKEEQNKGKIGREMHLPLSFSDDEDVANFFDESAAKEIEDTEEKLVLNTTAAENINELKIEIQTLYQLEKLALRVRESETDQKWIELSNLLQGESKATAAEALLDPQGNLRKIIIFTEHLDTLSYLTDRIRILLGRSEAVVTISGSTRSEERRKIQDAFQQDPTVQVLVATDAAGEGINLHSAHLMVNYDLPWNPNRIEQRFGRIHRIGQTEMCHLWNLVASDTREGEVFKTLLYKIEQQKETLGSAVFDVLGECFTNTSLRNLLIDAIRKGDDPEAKARLDKVIENAFDIDHIRNLIEENVLSRGIINTKELGYMREDMERAEAKRLQPYFVASFVREAFTSLRGTLHEAKGNERGRYKITIVPREIRSQNMQIPYGYPCITFEQDKVDIEGKPKAEFVFPGHPLLNATLEAILKENRDLLRQGTVLIDPNEENKDVRILFYLEHAIQDGRMDYNRHRKKISQKLEFLEVDSNKKVNNSGYAPYLDYRPIDEETELPQIRSLLNEPWLNEDLEADIKDYAVKNLIPEHLNEVKARKEGIVHKTLNVVQERLQKEIDHCEDEIKAFKTVEEVCASLIEAGRTEEVEGIFASLTEAGRTDYKEVLKKLKNAKEKAERQVVEFKTRLKRRTEELEQELRISAMPPQVIGGALIVPQCLLDIPDQEDIALAEISQTDRSLIDRIAVDAVMETERALGNEPKEMEHHNPGYDIESKNPKTNELRFIEVKGKSKDERTITITKTQIFTALNKPNNFILAIVTVEDEAAKDIRYIRKPFEKNLDFIMTSTTYNLKKLLDRSEDPK